MLFRSELLNILKLKNIKNLKLEFTNIESIPSEIGQSKLVNLSLLGNKKLKEIPKEIGNLTNLTNLYIQDSPLIDEVPNEITNLKKLYSLKLSSCNLKEIPDLNKLENLRYLDISRNKLTTVLNQINKLYLKRLSINHNLIEKQEVLDVINKFKRITDYDWQFGKKFWTY